MKKIIFIILLAVIVNFVVFAVTGDDSCPKEPGVISIPECTFDITGGLPLKYDREVFNNSASFLKLVTDMLFWITTVYLADKVLFRRKYA